MHLLHPHDSSLFCDRVLGSTFLLPKVLALPPCMQEHETRSSTLDSKIRTQQETRQQVRLGQGTYSECCSHLLFTAAAYVIARKHIHSCRALYTQRP